MQPDNPYPVKKNRRYRVNPLQLLENLEQPIKPVGNEFLEFLKKYSIISLAVGVVMGGAVNQFINTLIKAIINPLLAAATPNGKFDNLNKFIFIRQEPLLIGDLINALVTFLTVSFIVFVAVRYIIKVDKNEIKDLKAAKKKTVKSK